MVNCNFALSRTVSEIFSLLDLIWLGFPYLGPVLSGFVGKQTLYHFPIFTANELVLTISVIYPCSKFRQNPFIIACLECEQIHTVSERASDRASRNTHRLD